MTVVSTNAPRFIFVTGGVVSSLGKGIAAASMGALLRASGYKVRLRKLDPYLNIDPGTMSPYQHGEVFVTEDGAETDLDLGHYERFTGLNASRADAITAGRIYQTVLRRERRGDYAGSTVQVIPHVTDTIKEYIMAETDGVDFVICEIGGTVGDIEGLPFLEAIRQMGSDLGRERTLYVHLTLLPYVSSAGELKTKPTQHSVRELRTAGIQPDLLLCRSDRAIPAEERRKIALFCNVRPTAVIEALTVETIYAVPRAYAQQNVHHEIAKVLNIANMPEPNLQPWDDLVQATTADTPRVNIAIVGKYTELPDAYKSLFEALQHAGAALGVKPVIQSCESEAPDLLQQLANANAVLVPGGFGERGAEGKIAAVQYARQNNVPFFGICFGMQMAVVETARHVAGLAGAGSAEFGACADALVVPLADLRTDLLGGTMRLGSCEAVLTAGSLMSQIYGTSRIAERHRHRYEVDMRYRDTLQRAGMVISATSADGMLPEAVERPDHPWFVAVQYHPELKSRPHTPHPLFVAFVQAAAAAKAAQ